MRFAWGLFACMAVGQVILSQGHPVQNFDHIAEVPCGEQERCVSENDCHFAGSGEECGVGYRCCLANYIMNSAGSEPELDNEGYVRDVSVLPEEAESEEYRPEVMNLRSISENADESVLSPDLRSRSLPTERQ